jgi:GNAT superfamily N-acetyltransferase
MQNVELKRMNTCSFQTVVDVWNEGFKGYFVDMTLTLEQLLTRIIAEGILLDFSLVAFVDERPVGFLFNGIRDASFRKRAWNGGTAVVPEFRGKGIGRRLVNSAVEIYAAEGVNIATLEAISSNEPAIGLYESFNYQVIDELTFLQTELVIDDFPTTRFYSLRQVHPAVVGSLNFYNDECPWQGHWMSVMLNHGEALVVLDKQDNPVGYALSKKRFDDAGQLVSIALYQCEVSPHCDDKDQIIAAALNAAFVPSSGPCLRRTNNLSKSNRTIGLLENAGFTTFIEQAHMSLELLR